MKYQTMIESHVDVDRINRRLDDLWEIGRTDRGGVTRLAYSEEESEAIEYILDELDDRFSVETDSIGNVFAATEPDAPTQFYVGSHLDSVFDGGRLDGTLGVVTALEAIEAVLDADDDPPAPPTLAIFRGEESSRFGQHTIGSRGALGLLTVEDFAAVDQNNIPLWQAIQNCGFRPKNLSEPTIDIERIGAFLELHIEQGRVLDETDEDVAIVSSIRAPVRYRANVTGEDDHSGATPMEMRRDAVAAAAEMIVAVERVGTGAATEGDLVATVGDVSVPGGAINKVCGEATFPIDIRSNDLAYRNDVEEDVLEELAEIATRRDVSIDLEQLDVSEPVELDTGVISLLDELAEDAGYDYRVMPSGGGHDAMNFQHVNIPTGLLFTPSIDGISHNPQEETTTDGIKAGTELIARAIMSGPQ